MTILDHLLAELRTAKGPISTSDLARRLEVSESALDGMMAVLIATGQLSGDEPQGDTYACSGVACGTTCVGLEDCAFIVSVPTTVALVVEPVAR